MPSRSDHRTRGRRFVAGAAVIVGAAALAAGTLTAVLRPASTAGASARPPLETTLTAALQGAARLGPLPSGRRLELTFPLRTRNGPQLTRLVATGRRVGLTSYDDSFGPEPAAVTAAEAQIRAAGLRTSWTRGSDTLSVTGSAGAAERLLSVSLERYRARSGQAFYAAEGEPQLQGALGRVAASVVGLDDFPLLQTAGIPATAVPNDPGGHTPTQVFDFYHFQPLVQAGLDGAGETITFLEIDQFQQADLDLYDRTFGLPASAVEVHTNANWGTPSATEGEADLDLEVAHAAAPAAKLVVYYAGPALSGGLAAYAAMVAQYPHAIISTSIDACETGDQQLAAAYDAIFKQFAATGGSVFNSSGDSGAYGCDRDDPVDSYSPAKETPALMTPADDPYVTGVGGTSIFEGAGDTYGREMAWGDPVEQSGGGGGLSAFFPRPSWQAAPGVVNSYSNGKRQVPDVASLGDSNTGWDIAINGQFELIGGTSSGAPLWAGLAALADQALTAHHRRTIGFVNPALYAIAADPARYAAPAFHDVTVGNNLYYPATSGWDFATGLGTPDAAALVDDLLQYEPAS